MRSTIEDKLLWEQRINERINSGLTVTKWCENNGISKHKYNYWNHRIRKNQKLDQEMTFAEITPLLSNTDDTILNLARPNDFQMFFKNIQITIPSNFNPVSLSGLMKVLQEL